MPTVEARAQLLNRLRSVEGHLRGVIKMVEQDAYCMDVLKQLQAVQGAIGKVNALLLADHLQTCVTTAIRGDEPAERERVIGELLGLFEQGARLAGSGQSGRGEIGGGVGPEAAAPPERAVTTPAGASHGHESD